MPPDRAGSGAGSSIARRPRGPPRHTATQPGKIPHEYWDYAPQHIRDQHWPLRGDELLYYGSADASCWFLITLAHLRDAQFAEALDAAWRTCGQWLRASTAHGQDLLWHGPRLHPGGLIQQGWRDVTSPPDQSPEGGGIVDADGHAPTALLADADTQAVAVVTYRALVALSNDPCIADEASRMTVGARFAADTIAIDAFGQRIAGAAPTSDGCCGPTAGTTGRSPRSLNASPARTS